MLMRTRRINWRLCLDNDRIRHLVHEMDLRDTWNSHRQERDGTLSGRSVSEEKDDCANRNNGYFLLLTAGQ